MVRVIAVEGVPGVGKTTCIQALQQRFSERGVTSTIIPEVVTPFPPAPVPSSFFVQNDYNKWELAKSATTDAVLMDRTWVSTNSCATILRKRGHVQHHTSAEFAVDGCIFISMLQTPWSPTPTDWPWTLPNFLADWEREALVNLRALTVNVFFWRGDLRDAEEFILKLGVGSE
jgi:hypothetical protein